MMDKTLSYSDKTHQKSMFAQDTMDAPHVQNPNGVAPPVSPTPRVSSAPKPPRGSPTPPTLDDLNRNHRQRLRERLMLAGRASLQDYEMLELIMFRAIPRRDIKPLAKTLLAEFGSFSRVINAPEERLLEIKGIGQSVIQEFRIVVAACERLAQVEVLHRHVLKHWKDLVDYCRISLAHKHIEQFRILFLDKKHNLIADEQQQTGSIDHVPVYTREVVKRALQVNASALILVHNHPSGNPDPSDGDIHMTQMIQHALQAVNIDLHDHIIVGAERIYSFQDAGRLG